MCCGFAISNKKMGKAKGGQVKAVDKYINYLNEIMQDHYDNNKSIYSDETPEWKKVDRMNNKIMWIVRDYFEEKKNK